MTTLACPFCGALGMRPGWVCAACGRMVSFARLPSYIARGINLRAVAHRQRTVLWLVLAMIITPMPVLIAGRLHPLIELGGELVYLGVVVTASIYLILLMTAMRYHWRRVERIPCLKSTSSC